MAAMNQQWVRWTVIVLAVVLAFGLALSVVPADAAVRRPPVNGTADYQLGGAYRPGAGVDVVVRDRTESPAAGRYNICYVNAFQTQPGTLQWWRKNHPGLLLRKEGELVHDPGWPGEVLLDTSRAGKRRELASVLGRWVERCARDGFDAVEPDNLDSFTRSRGKLRRSDNLRLAGALARRAHAAGLAIAQKNTAGLSPERVRDVQFDFAVAEDCQVYSECGRYRGLYGRHVIEVEYADEGRANFRRACRARGDRWAVVYRDRDLRRRGEDGFVRAFC